MKKRSYDSIVKERQIKQSKTQQLITQKNKKTKWCDYTTLQALTYGDLEPFLANKELQLSFIYARLHWLIADVHTNRIISDVNTRNNIRKFQSSHASVFQCDSSLKIEKLTRLNFIAYRKRNFLAYIRSSECKLLRKELIEIGNKNLIAIYTRKNEYQNRIMQFIYLHEIHHLILYNWLGYELGIPKIFNKTGFSFDSVQRYYFHNFFANTTVFRLQKKQGILSQTITITGKPDWCIKCFEELSVVFQQYYPFFSLICAFAQ